MKMTMAFEGGAELAKALDSLSTRVSKTVARDALYAGAEPLRAGAARRAPRGDPKEPNLADNMVVSTARATAQGDIAAVVVGPARGEVYYGRFQEFGTMHHGAQPFLRPAFDGDGPKALDEIRRAMWTALSARGVIRVRTAPSGLTGGLV